MCAVKTISPKQRAALQRGRYVRNTRGALALLRYLLYCYQSTDAGYSYLVKAIENITDWHNQQFGPAKCAICKQPVLLDPLQYICTKCRGEV